MKTSRMYELARRERARKCSTHGRFPRSREKVVVGLHTAGLAAVLVAAPEKVLGALHPPVRSRGRPDEVGSPASLHFLLFLRAALQLRELAAGILHLYLPIAPRISHELPREGALAFVDVGSHHRGCLGRFACVTAHREACEAKVALGFGVWLKVLAFFSDEFQCRRRGVQFRRGSPRFPIPSIEPHEAPHPVLRGRKAMLIGTFLVTQLGAVHLNPQVAVDFG